MDVVLAERAVRSVPVVLRYDLADPYAVTLEFHLVPGQEVRWVVGRDLVARGLRAPAGVGDVQIRPSGSRSTRSVRIALTSPEGHAVVLARAADLEGFLRTTAELCPPGSEGDRLDVDGALGSLLTP
jgi:hypothetical protein